MRSSKATREVEESEVVRIKIIVNNILSIVLGIFFNLVIDIIEKFIYKLNKFIIYIYVNIYISLI